MGNPRRSEDFEAHPPRETDHDPSASRPDDEHRILEVREALRVVLLSTPFRTSPQCQKLLTYLVDHSLAGRLELLRERVIGAEVFGREPDYDAANDPVVRLRVAEVRKRLAQYYLCAPSSSRPVRIEIPSGHYRARFVHAAAEGLPLLYTGGTAERGRPTVDVIPARPVAGPIPVAPAGAAALRSAGWLRRGVAIGCVALIAAASALTGRILWTGRMDAFSQFWSPAMNSPMPVIIYTGTNVVFRLSPSFLDRYRRSHHLQNTGPELAVDLKSAGPITADDFVPSTNVYVTVGDVSAFTAITSMLAQRHKAYDLRYARDFSPGDLHSAPTVLIGAFNNRWTIDVTNPLRLAFSGGDTITDKQENRSWKVHIKPDGSTTDDYAIVSRLLSADGRETIMTAAGIGQYGTQAASEFLSSAAGIAQFARRAPRGWARKNLQIVLHIHVVDDVPGSVDIVATTFW
ncbi:MAG: hypothetical protein WA294_19240 [Acidobacteriaceae bacterium]